VKPVRRFIRGFVAVAAPATLLISFSATAAHASRGASTLVVDDNGAQCPTATFTTISAAVAAASPGDTIKVCAGIYPETVTVDKQLTFLGAKSGVDARTGRTNLTNEAVVNNPNGDFKILGGVNGVTIDGFTIEGAGSDATTAYGISAFQGSSGLTVVNNVIRDNEEGMNFQNPDASQPALIQHNNFINNDNGTTAEGGTGVFISNGPANSTSIVQNKFTGHRQTAVNFAGSSTHSVGLLVDGNQSVNDSTFVVAINSDNALIDSNTITYSGSNNGTAILDFGSNNNLRILSNSINGGNGTGTSGIKLADFSGAPSVGTTVNGNTVKGRYWGIRIAAPVAGPVGYTSALVNQNMVKNSAAIGIWVQTGSSGNDLTRNVVTGTPGGLNACEDDTTGPLTAGTANTWTRDVALGSLSSPSGICKA
jgi:Right handed beta helix region